MFILTALGDEISPDVERQMDLLAEQEICHVEFRGAKSLPVFSLRKNQLKAIRKKLDGRGFHVSAIASRIGKIRIDEDFAEHLKQFERIQEDAELLQTRFIRVFSFYPDMSGNLLNRRDEVLGRLEKLVELARGRGMVLLLENDERVYGERPERARDILQAINSEHLRATFDIGNFVEAGVRPFDQAYPLLREFIEYVHVKDARLLPNGKCKFVTAGHGGGQVAQVLAALAKQGREIYLSVEPRGATEETEGGEPDPRLFGQAVEALKKVLVQIGACPPPETVIPPEP